MTTLDTIKAEVVKRFEEIDLCGCTRVCYGHEGLKKILKDLALSEIDRAVAATYKQVVGEVEKRKSHLFYPFGDKALSMNEGWDRAIDDLLQKLKDMK